jgi:xylan 1,4-beta-xylosidase
LPFLLTEYNVGCCLGYPQHETAAAAAFVFRAVGELNDYVEMYSYWTFSDVFEEGGLPEVEFLGVYGAMTISGIPKPVWTAFQLLHTHAGDHRLPTVVGPQGNVSYISAMATTNSSSSRGAGINDNGNNGEDGGSSLRVFLGFWGNPDLCCNATARTVRLTVNHGAAAAGSQQLLLPTKAVLHVIDDTHGNVQALWHSLGAPNKPSSAQLAQLKAASAAGVVPVPVTAVNASATAVTVPMTENSAVVVEYL